MMESGAQVLNEFLQAIFPERCPVCGVGGGTPGPCEWHRLRRERGVARCRGCAARLPAGLPDQGRCARCTRRSLGLCEVRTLGDYHRQAVLRDWVLALKHGGRRGLAQPLGLALAGQFLPGQCLPGRWTAAGASCDARRVLVPVPLHPLRRLERGYDQALLLARAVGRGLGCEVLRCLRRGRWTEPQGNSNGSRASNVAGAFQARQTSLSLEGCEVWLVDDVLASGSTLQACARVLRAMGARRVGALVVARAAAREPGLE